MVALLALGMTAAFAAPTEVTLNVNDADHTYKVFQLFTGELLDGKLAKLAWGENSGHAAGSLTDAEVTALNAVVAGISDTATDQEILTAMAGYIGSLEDDDAVTATIVTM